MNILDNTIEWTPIILHFKGLGMRNLQYEMRICQKSHSKVSRTIYEWFDFLWISHYKGIFTFKKTYLRSKSPGKCWSGLGEYCHTTSST